MRLPWRKARVREEPVADEPRPGMDEALAAVHAARNAVGDARSRTPQVDLLVERLRSLREENHISARFEEALRNGFREGGHANGG